MWNLKVNFDDVEGEPSRTAKGISCQVPGIAAGQLLTLQIEREGWTISYVTDLCQGKWDAPGKNVDSLLLNEDL